METIYYQSPIGVLRITGMHDRLLEISFSDFVSEQRGGNGLLSETARQLDEYFEGNRTDFDIPFAPAGTEFQMEVWKELQNIPYGSTLTYLELAERLNDRTAARAVGRANGQNVIPIIIPCHRVVGAKGKLTGYSGGVERKKWLLKHEGALLL